MILLQFDQWFVAIWVDFLLSTLLREDGRKRTHLQILILICARKLIVLRCEECVAQNGRLFKNL